MVIPTADERQAALEALYAWRDARDASEPDSDAYREHDQGYQMAQVFYWNLGYAWPAPAGNFFTRLNRPRDLLRLFEEMQVLHVEHRDRLRRELDED